MLLSISAFLWSKLYPWDLDDKGGARKSTCLAHGGEPELGQGQMP